MPAVVPAVEFLLIASNTKGVCRLRVRIEGFCGIHQLRQIFGVHAQAAQSVPLE